MLLKGLYDSALFKDVFRIIQMRGAFATTRTKDGPGGGNGPGGGFGIPVCQHSGMPRPKPFVEDLSGAFFVVMCV